MTTPEWPDVRVTKIGAGYVFVLDTYYRCRDCWKYLPRSFQCAEMRGVYNIQPHGYCIYWAYGEPAEQPIMGCFTPEELGYGEDPHGTGCHRCIFFDLESQRRCARVDENSSGDTPGMIHPEACCAHQEPRE